MEALIQSLQNSTGVLWSLCCGTDTLPLSLFHPARTRRWQFGAPDIGYGIFTDYSSECFRYWNDKHRGSNLFEDQRTTVEVLDRREIHVPPGAMTVRNDDQLELPIDLQHDSAVCSDDATLLAGPHADGTPALLFTVRITSHDAANPVLKNELKRMGSVDVKLLYTPRDVLGVLKWLVGNKIRIDYYSAYADGHRMGRGYFATADHKEAFLRCRRQDRPVFWLTDSGYDRFEDAFYLVFKNSQFRYGEKSAKLFLIP